jgi:hypothetical protein
VDIVCQIYNKEGHTTKDCWWHFEDDDDDTFDDKEVHITSYGVDINWYSDTGATRHITGELNNLMVHDNYKGHDKVNTTSGKGMEISHVGHSIVRNLDQNFHLCNILHVPTMSKNFHLCDPYQQAKSHQLPYPISTSVSTSPIQLVFSDVWGPTPTCVGRHDYVSFIDDYSMFTWIYFLKKKSCRFCLC